MWTVRIWKICDTSKTAQPVTLRAKQLSCSKENSWPCHLTHWRSEFATEVVQFDTVRLLSLGVCEISCLCQQTTNNLVSMSANHKQFLSSRRRFDCHWRNWAAIMWKCHREFRQKSKSVPAESWGTFVSYCVPQLTAVCVLYNGIEISALFE